MKKLLLLGAALLGLCAAGQTARAGDDGPVYNDRPAPRYYEGEVVRPRCYLPPPPPPVYYAPAPVIYARPYFHHRRFYRPYPYAYGYGYGYAPGVHIGIGF